MVQNLNKKEVQECAKIPADMSQNPRWIYIRIFDINIKSSQQIAQQIENKIKFEMGDKKSFSLFYQQTKQVQEPIKKQKVSKTKDSQNLKNQNHTKIREYVINNLRQETHLFCYQGQQILTVKIIRRKKIKEGDQQKFQLLPEIAFGKILITPFVVIPYTRHKVRLNMILMKKSMAVEQKQIATIDLEIFYFLNFQAKIQISPLYGRITRNTAVIGVMRLCCIITINGQKKKSIIAEDGGIYPNWRKQCEKVKDVQKFTKQQLDNNFQFNLISVGHTMKIQIVNYPLLDKDAQLVGQAQIKLSSLNFFRNPEKQVIHDKQKIVKLQYVNPLNGVVEHAGQIVFKSIFHFNAQSIRNQVDSEQQEQKN